MTGRLWKGLTRNSIQDTIDANTTAHSKQHDNTWNTNLTGKVQVIFQLHRETVDVKKALNKKIVAAIEKKYVQAIKNSIMKSITKPVLEVILNLFENCDQVQKTNYKHKQYVK